MPQKIYDENGWLDFGVLAAYPETFQFVIGARGVGKTYGALKWCVENDEIFVYTRRTQRQIDILNSPAMNVFKPYNMNTGRHISIAKTTQGVGLYVDEDRDDKDIIGYNMALSTFSNFRGFSLQDVNVWIFDEFVPEASETVRAVEGESFLNAYETMNRNRELSGDKPIRVFCLANSNTLDNPIFLTLGIVDNVIRAEDTGQMFYVDKERGIRVTLISNSPISQKKKMTALYRLTASNSEFTNMALKNIFGRKDFSPTGSRNLSEYTPVVFVGELAIYKHKSRREFYVTKHRVGTPPMILTTGRNDLKRFQMRYGFFSMLYMANRIIFESTSLEIIFQHYLEDAV